jgi:hypothetical protein
VRHGDKVGKWIVIEGVRTHYRGKLVHVEELAVDCILQLKPCYALEALADTTNEVEIETTQGPFEIYTQGILGLGHQPKRWPSG